MADNTIDLLTPGPDSRSAANRSCGFRNPATWQARSRACPGSDSARLDALSRRIRPAQSVSVGGDAGAAGPGGAAAAGIGADQAKPSPPRHVAMSCSAGRRGRPAGGAARWLGGLATAKGSAPKPTGGQIFRASHAASPATDPANKDDPKWLNRRADRLRNLADKKQRALEHKIAKRPPRALP